MDPRERVDSLLVAVRAAVAGAQPGIWTALPGVVQSFDAVKGTCSVQPAIQAKVYDKTGAGKFVNLPVCVDVPVQFMGTNDFVFTVPVKKDVEGIIIFACRCIDAWWQSGSVQPQAEMRMHDLSDGMFIPGLRSQAHKITNFNQNFPEWRSADGAIKIEQTATGYRVTGSLEVNGDLHLSGNVLSVPGATYTGDFRTTGNVIAGVGGADQVGLQTHKHSALNQAPTPGT